MRYVHRDSSGKLIGHFANEQSYAREAVPDDHHDIIEWRDRHKRENEEYLRRKAMMDPEKLMARLEAIEKRLGL